MLNERGLPRESGPVSDQRLAKTSVDCDWRVHGALTVVWPSCDPNR